MNIHKSTIVALTLTVSLAACGGGGGGGGGGNSTPLPGGGGTGGGGTATLSPSGLVSGGLGVVVDSTVSGFQIDVVRDGTGAWLGDIQDFSSIILNDVTTNTDNATFTVEGVAGGQSDLKQGQQVLVLGDGVTSTASEVHYRSNVKGPVTGVAITDAILGTAVVVVLGQTIHLDGTTTLANVELVALQVDDLLEVSGTLDANGEIRASFVELKTTLAEYKVIGIVNNLTSTTFGLDALLVDFSSATLSDFSSGAIASGDAVEVKGAPTDFTAPGNLTATEVENLPTFTVGGNAILQTEGFIDRFVSATDFDVQSTLITTDGNTVFVNGDINSLAINVKVQVEGAGDGNGAILATRITIQPTNTVRAEGNIESIDIANNSVTLLSTTFFIRDLTRLEDKTAADVDPLAISDLGIGDEIEVRGYLDAASVVATRLRREDPRDRARLRGPVTAEDPAAGTVSLLGVLVTGQFGITQYEDINENVITQTEFHDSVELHDFIKAEWDVFSATSEIADKLSLED